MRTFAGLAVGVCALASCTITGAIIGTSVFPRGVPDMVAFGEQRYLSTSAGCHGNDGRVGAGVRGESANSTTEAIRDERSVRFLGCLSPSDIQLATSFLSSGEAGNGGSGGAVCARAGRVLLGLTATGRRASIAEWSGRRGGLRALDDPVVKDASVCGHGNRDR